MVTKTLSEKNASAADKPQSTRTVGFIKGVTWSVIIAGTVLGGAWYLQQNPQILQKINNDSAEQNAILRLEGKINALQTEVNELKRLNAEAKNDSLQLAAMLNGKIDNVNKINSEILDSRVSTNTMLGVVSRIDALESKLRAFGQVSTRGALTLTAAMLVKDSAATGKPFVYEAEVLRNLALGTNMEAPADVIASLSYEGIPSAEELTERFNRLYVNEQTKQTAAEIAKAEQAESAKNTQKEPDWKEKINSKLSKLISIEYHDKPVAELMAKDEVYRLVNEGKFSEASVLMSAKPEYQTEDFAKWQKQSTATEDFNQALKQIEALTIAVMKAENLTAENN
ncbi:MAG: hypothetical protein SO141_00885 [Alphaproteobacteria bacterium]|nr:hypothetical protein [Alphaproteobacteria bacterium]